MVTAVGYPVLIRGFRLTLSVEGLRPKTFDNYVRDVERFATQASVTSPQEAAPAVVRAYILDLQGRRAAKTVYEAQLALRRFFLLEGQHPVILEHMSGQWKVPRRGLQ